eukprot:353494-Chlamydomonas_euryale.AAC.1
MEPFQGRALLQAFVATTLLQGLAMAPHLFLPCGVSNAAEQSNPAKHLHVPGRTDPGCACGISITESEGQSYIELA